jgi:hypothetical protein
MCLHAAPPYGAPSCMHRPHGHTCPYSTSLGSALQPRASCFLQVKYTRSYGASVHRAWAAVGLAPDLLRLEPLPGGWFAVTLQYLALEDGWVGLNALLACRLRGGSTQQAGVGGGQQPEQRMAHQQSVPVAGSSQLLTPGAAPAAMSMAEVRAQCHALTPDEWAGLCAHVERQVRMAHRALVPVGSAGAEAGARVHPAHAPARDALASSSSSSSSSSSAAPAPAAPAAGSCGVHGDMRPPNILLQLKPGASLTAITPQVRFIDFDWAGMDGTARYPPFLSNQVRVHVHCVSGMWCSAQSACAAACAAVSHE